MASFQFERVSHRRHGDFDALVGFDLDVADEGAVALVGGVGSGASTALRLLAGFEEPEHGRIRIGGRDLAGLAPRDRKVALVLPHHGLSPERTVADHLVYPLLVSGVSSADRQRRVRDVAEQLGFDALLDCLPRQLTPAERQRVAFGRAIVRRPEVLLVEEPWSGLVGSDRAEVRDECSRCRTDLATTIIAVVRDPADADSIAKRVICLDGGVATFERSEPVLA